MIRILTVCTGNICRSPFAELFLQAELNRISPESFVIQSAGTHALAGHHMDERSSIKLNEVGVSSDGFIARQLTAEMTSEIDLVLALTDKHRSNIVALRPRLLKRTYTVREFAAVLGALAANPGLSFPRGNQAPKVSERWESVLKVAPLSRHAVRRTLMEDIDVVDPYRQSDDVYEQMVKELLPALKSIVDFELEHCNE